MSMILGQFARLGRAPIRDFHHPVTITQLRPRLAVDVQQAHFPFFKAALTHASDTTAACCYQRLEYIGDVIVKLAISITLYCTFPGASEAGLSVCGAFYKSNEELGKASLRLGLSELARFGPCTRGIIRSGTGGIAKMHGDLFESVTAAIAVSCGLRRAVEFVQEQVIGSTFLNRADEPQTGAKATCVIRLQDAFRGRTPIYETWQNKGVHHSYVSVAGVQLPFIGESRDKTKSMELASLQITNAMNAYPSFLPRVKAMVELTEDG